MVSSNSYAALRTFLYFLLCIFSLVLIGLTAARIHYTTHLKPWDPLNGGVNFYDPIVAELLVCGILSAIWSPFVMHMIHGRREFGILSRVWHELVGLFILWLMWLVGSGISTHIWPNLPKICPQYEACRILTAMVAFAWIGWITLTAIMITTMMYAYANSSWAEPAHGNWSTSRADPRMSEYSQYSIRA